MGGQSFYASTQESTTAPWSVHSSSARTVITLPLWKELPWHLENPGLFAILAGTLVTAALWLLTNI